MGEFKDKNFAGERKAEQGEIASIQEGENPCAHCGTDNEREAKYCSECGERLQAPGKCPSCGAAVLPGADICEACGEWLLEGQCKFCYAFLEEGAQFCAECGNPIAGVVCPKCGRLSYFDFCKHCSIPLTPQASEMIKELQQSEELQALLRELGNAIPPEQAAPQDEELQVLEQLKQYKEQLKRAGKPQKAEAKKGFRLGQVDEMVKRAQEAPQGQGEARPMLSALEQLQKRQFKSNQEARRFFGALKVLLPRVTKKLLGWRCNAYDCLHPDGPQGCADPSPGGTWIFEEQTEIKEVTI